MNNIKVAIEQGKVNEYLEKLLLKDDDLPSLNKYVKLVEQPSLLKEKIQNTVNSMVDKMLTTSPVDIKSHPSFVLVRSLSKDNKNNDLIIDELVKRYNDKQIKSKILVLAIKNNQSISIELLKKVPEDIQREYKESHKFSSLNNEKEFDKFYELQSSGLYTVAITSLDNLEKSFSLWDTKQEQIKDAFSYLDIWMIQILSKSMSNALSNNLNPKDIQIKTECITHYVNKFLEDTTTDSLSSEQYHKEQKKSNLIDICTNLKLNESLENLKNHSYQPKSPNLKY